MRQERYPYIDKFCFLNTEGSMEENGLLVGNDGPSLRMGMIFDAVRCFDSFSYMDWRTNEHNVWDLFMGSTRNLFHSFSFEAVPWADYKEEPAFEDLWDYFFGPEGDHILCANILVKHPYIGCFREQQTILFAFKMDHTFVDAVWSQLEVILRHADTKTTRKLVVDFYDAVEIVVGKRARLCEWIAEGELGKFLGKLHKQHKEEASLDTVFKELAEGPLRRHLSKDLDKEELVLNMRSAMVMEGHHDVNTMSMLCRMTGCDPEGEGMCAPCDFPFVWRSALSEEWVFDESPVDYIGSRGNGGIGVILEGPICEQDMDEAACPGCGDTDPKWYHFHECVDRGECCEFCQVFEKDLFDSSIDRELEECDRKRRYKAIKEEDRFLSKDSESRIDFLKGKAVCCLCFKEEERKEVEKSGYALSFPFMDKKQ